MSIFSTEGELFQFVRPVWWKFPSMSMDMLCFDMFVQSSTRTKKSMKGLNTTCDWHWRNDFHPTSVGKFFAPRNITIILLFMLRLLHVHLSCWCNYSNSVWHMKPHLKMSDSLKIDFAAECVNKDCGDWIMVTCPADPCFPGPGRREMDGKVQINP